MSAPFSGWRWNPGDQWWEYKKYEAFSCHWAHQKWRAKSSTGAEERRWIRPRIWWVTNSRDMLFVIFVSEFFFLFPYKIITLWSVRFSLIEDFWFSQHNSANKTTLLFAILLYSTSLFSLICFSLFLIFYSLVGSSAMMGPHLAACLRNDKLGEPCFYLMSQNQATVCRALSVCAMPPHHCCILYALVCVLSLLYITPSCAVPYLHHISISPW